MPAITEVGQYQQDEKDALERWADEVGIPMDQLEVRILLMADRVVGVERRSAARLAADNAILRSRLAAQCAQEAQAENVVSIFPSR
ncbi:hypothetical protein PS918_03105 [Pseudomonas fluorescens]|uniref:Uncharacterized protein n=1 Tax=Pseudomonas fluorescens TaxID=294 RepID=A0A5E7STA5_PSEFL|nr:hypothetical protein [Pseudomonas fluorescens]VVP89636.1 hypothetical protein PS918_03105 [Pseudomonas fluorescens]